MEFSDFFPSPNNKVPGTEFDFKLDTDRDFFLKCDLIDQLVFFDVDDGFTRLFRDSSTSAAAVNDKTGRTE
jgi:hypothetical protein